MASELLHVTHVITGLNTGGAERQLMRLLRVWQQDGLSSSVIALGPEGTMSDSVRALGLPLTHLDMRFGARGLLAPDRLTRALRTLKPDVIQTWMYHADLLGGLCARVVNRPCVWNIRNLNLDPAVHSRSTLPVVKTCARLSRRLPTHILSNSNSARAVHIDAGYFADHFTVIPNGYDTDKFRPDPEQAGALRQKMGIAPEAHVIGHVARLDPQKDHRTFLKAIQEYYEQGHDAVFVLIGKQVHPDTSEFRDWLREFELEDRILTPNGSTKGASGGLMFLNERRDVDQLYRLMDIYCLSSSSEASPNVIGEAMSSGVPCVSTDVGDAGLIMGKTGVLVAAGDSTALAKGWRTLLERSPKERETQAIAVRDRIVAHFRTEEIAKKYEALYRSLATHSS